MVQCFSQWQGEIFLALELKHPSLQTSPLLELGPDPTLPPPSPPKKAGGVCFSCPQPTVLYATHLSVNEHRKQRLIDKNTSVN